MYALCVFIWEVLVFFDPRGQREKLTGRSVGVRRFPPLPIPSRSNFHSAVVIFDLRHQTL